MFRKAVSYSVVDNLLQIRTSIYTALSLVSFLVCDLALQDVWVCDGVTPKDQTSIYSQTSLKGSPKGRTKIGC